MFSSGLNLVHSSREGGRLLCMKITSTSVSCPSLLSGLNKPFLSTIQAIQAP